MYSRTSLLQTILSKLISRLLSCSQVEVLLTPGMIYTMLVKTGTDGQTGWGSNAKCGKTVNDNKW